MKRISTTKQDNDEIFTYSLGAQFRDGSTAYLFLGLLIFVMLEAVFIAQSEFKTALILSPSLVLIFFYVFDFRGVQVNKSKGLVREYRLNAWGKSGKWIDFNQFQTILLSYESFGVKSANFSGGFNSGTVLEKHGLFLVALADSNAETYIILAELQNYQEAKTFAFKTSKELDLPLKDRFEKRLFESRRRPKR